jgi:hypothetical protein
MHAAAIISVLLAYPCYGSGGRLEPIINMGALSIVETEKPTPPDGNGFVENGIPAVENAFRKVWASTPSASGSEIPNTMEFAGLRAPGAIAHWVRPKIRWIWKAKNRASGSPSIYRRFTEPGCSLSAASSFCASSGETVRQANWALSCSVSNRALAASFPSVAASFSSAAALTSASPAAFPASMPSFLASATWAATPILYAIAGWSQARRSCEAYVIRGGADQACVFPPWKLIALDGLAFAPQPKDDVPFDPEHIERDMVALMEAQRRDCTGVGGFCQLTTLTEHAITQRVLCRWPISEVDHLPPALLDSLREVA